MSNMPDVWGIITGAVNNVVSKILWVFGIIIGLGAATILTIALMRYFGIQLQWFKQIPNLDLLYLMGAVCLYGYNKRA